MKETEILDSLEEILVSTAKNIFEKAGVSLSIDEARNVVSKIGTRIMWTKELGKERMDEIIMGKQSPNPLT
jgi:hypothetical protein